MSFIELTNFKSLF